MFAPSNLICKEWLPPFLIVGVLVNARVAPIKNAGLEPAARLVGPNAGAAAEFVSPLQYTVAAAILELPELLLNEFAVVFTNIPYFIALVFPLNRSRSAILVTRPTANSTAWHILFSVPPSVAVEAAALSVLNRKFKIKGPVNGFAEITYGVSVKFTVPDLTTEILFAFPRDNTFVGAFEKRVKFVGVNAPV
jgi:hypothetical protein